MSQPRVEKSSGVVDFSGVKNIESAFNVYQFTILRPYVEIVAGDHLDFDQQTHLRAKHKRRKAGTLTPLSEVLPDWPKVIITFSCIDGRVVDPNACFIRLMKKPGVFPSQILELFSQRLSAKVRN